MSKQILSLVFILVSLSAFCQLPPPPADLANEDCKPYIDELVEVCDYESAFYFFRDSIIKEFSLKKGWSDEKISVAKEKIKYEYREFMFYNAFAKHTKEELSNLIGKYKKLNAEELKKEFPNYNSLVLFNYKNNIIGQCEYINERSND